MLIPKDNEKEIPQGFDDIEVKAINNIDELLEIIFD